MRNKTSILFTLFSLAAIISLACNRSIISLISDPTSTYTPTSTFTTIPTETATPTQTYTPTLTPTSTNTPIPTATPVALAGKLLGETLVIGEGGFSFQELDEFEISYFDTGAMMVSQDESVVLSLVGFSLSENDNTLEEINGIFMSALSSEYETEIKVSDPYTIIIDGVTGSAYDIDSEDAYFVGQTFVVESNPGFAIFGTGLGLSRGYIDFWKRNGQAAFDALISSIKFLPVTSDSPLT